ncbi:MAG: hypothetical protein ACR2HX_08425 [Pyrinomonadaceae bacterium]
MSAIKQTLNTEPRAVAPDAGVNLVLSRFPLLNSEVELSIQRIHHPSGAAPPGTPVRASVL